jgi:hypothetical protein
LSVSAEEGAVLSASCERRNSVRQFTHTQFRPTSFSSTLRVATSPARNVQRHGALPADSIWPVYG